MKVALMASLALASCALLTAAVSGSNQQVYAHDIDEEYVDDQIRVLGDVSFEVRQDAEDNLVREARQSSGNYQLINSKIRPHLNSADLEVRLRARTVDLELALMVNPHYSCYFYVGPFEETEPTFVEYVDQFHPSEKRGRLGLKEPSRLCEPVAFKFRVPAAFLPPLHCYLTESEQTLPDVRLRDQFDDFKTALLKPAFYCVPLEVKVRQDTSEFRAFDSDFSAPFVCYAIPVDPDRPNLFRFIGFTNQFGAWSGIVGLQPKYFCTRPRIKAVGEGVTEYKTGSRLVCWNLVGWPPLRIPVGLTVWTQFGPELDLKVRDLNVFCNPLQEKSVGGIFVGADLGALPQEAGDPAGSSVGLLAGIASAATAGVVALGGAAWYGRKRWTG